MEWDVGEYSSQLASSHLAMNSFLFSLLAVCSSSETLLTLHSFDAFVYTFLITCHTQRSWGTSGKCCDSAGFRLVSAKRVCQSGLAHPAALDEDKGFRVVGRLVIYAVSHLLPQSNQTILQKVLFPVARSCGKESREGDISKENLDFSIS
jgi:hypothetical protein